jgi:hypothetical protein
MCRMLWAPSGESDQTKIIRSPSILKDRSCTCVVNALATVLDPISCSSTPIVVPCSSFQVANFIAALPVIAAKQIGKSVVACRSNSVVVLFG